MNFLFSLALFFCLTTSALAHDHWSMGVGPGLSTPVGGTSFERRVDTSWLGTLWARKDGVVGKWGAELNYDHFLNKDQFPSLQSVGPYVGLGLVRSFYESNRHTAHFLVGAGFSDADGAGRVAGKARLGADTHISDGWDLGLHLNYHLLTATKGKPVGHLLSPAVALSYHFGRKLSEAGASSSPKTVPVVVARASDADGDGIEDSKDRCPGTPKGESVNSLGCSDSKKVEIRLAVTFPSGKAELRPEDSGKVEEAARLLLQHKDVHAVVEGHTDNSGSATRNTRLSQQRAEAVRSALISKGVSPSRLSARGFGPDRPVADNKTAAGRAENRRVVLSIE